jgi:phosphoribosylglycinamide formyltransferase-1
MSISIFNIAVLVSGRGSNLQAIIDNIERKELDVNLSVVISDKKEAAALERAKKNGIETIFIDPMAYLNSQEYDKELIKNLRELSVDLICLAGYMRILGEEVIQTFEKKIINMHPSLLPAFPGLNAQKQAIKYGVKFSGCTVHFVDSRVDTGPIIMQTAVPVYDNDDEKSLSKRILEQEHYLYPKAIKMIRENKITISGRTVICKTI